MFNKKPTNCILISLRLLNVSRSKRQHNYHRFHLPNSEWNHKNSRNTWNFEFHSSSRQPLILSQTRNSLLWSWKIFFFAEYRLIENFDITGRQEDDQGWENGKLYWMKLEIPFSPSTSHFSSAVNNLHQLVDSMLSGWDEQGKRRTTKSWSWHCLSCSVLQFPAHSPLIFCLFFSPPFPPQQIVYDSHSVMIFLSDDSNCSLSIVCGFDMKENFFFLLHRISSHLIVFVLSFAVHTMVINKMILDGDGGGSLRSAATKETRLFGKNYVYFKLKWKSGTNGKRQKKVLCIKFSPE